VNIVNFVQSFAPELKGLGGDFIAAGAWDDVYFVDSLLDQVIELKGATEGAVLTCLCEVCKFVRWSL